MGKKSLWNEDFISICKLLIQINVEKKMCLLTTVHLKMLWVLQFNRGRGGEQEAGRIWSIIMSTVVNSHSKVPKRLQQELQGRQTVKDFTELGSAALNLPAEQIMPVLGRWGNWGTHSVVACLSSQKNLVWSKTENPWVLSLPTHSSSDKWRRSTVHKLW